MRAVIRVLVVAALAFGLGCARTDWIDRTLVTVDVTGTWYGHLGGTLPTEMLLELKQEGSIVTGALQQRTRRAGVDLSGSIEGTVAGDVFRFRNPRGTVEGELTVSGDEMNGPMSSFSGSVPMSLRRVDPSSLPASPPQ